MTGTDEDGTRARTAARSKLRTKVEATVKAKAERSAGRSAGRSTERSAEPGTGKSRAGKGRSRRFPVLTRDTARPEGGTRAMSAEHAAPYRQWPLLAVSGGVVLGLLLTILDFRTGCLVIGISLLGGAGLRRALPSVGMLAVRSRFTDMVTYGVLGFAIALLAMMAQPSPWFTVPFLRELLHFSVK